MTHAIKRQETNMGIMSNVVEGAGLVFTTGVLAKDLDQDMRGQTRQVLAEIDRLLKLAHTDKSKILWATFWVTDQRNREAMNEVWVEWIGKNLPARATVGVTLAQPKALVEIAVVAAK